MVHFCGCARDVLFFTDGKPWKMARTSHGDTMVIMALQGQKCSMCCKQMESTIHSLAHFMAFHGHDVMVLQESSMLTMLSVLFVNNDPLQPLKCVTDKAYGCPNHLCPLHNSLELRLMNPVYWVLLCKRFLEIMVLECHFNNIM